MFCGTINHRTPLTEIWKKLSKIEVLMKNKEAVSHAQEAELLSKTISKNSSDTNFPANFNKYTKEKQKGFIIPEQVRVINDQNQYNVPFTKNPFLNAFANRKSTATGQDKFSYELFKHMPDNLIEVFFKLFNLVWSTGIIPDDWKHAEVFALPKQGKDLYDPGNYRPISLKLQT